ncbi:MAG: hypothetical protein V7L02_24610 [Nostoc sp.]|uniref:hypothetical protein n=1 Tax=Nostoc sp. TaxID=1180 RepID=UPI002FF87EF7
MPPQAVIVLSISWQSSQFIKNYSFFVGYNGVVRSLLCNNLHIKRSPLLLKSGVGAIADWL